jgi:hypothetical protein
MEYRYQENSVNNLFFCKKQLSDFVQNNKKNILFSKRDFINKEFKIKFLGKGGQGNVYLINSNKCGTLVFKIYFIYSDCNKEVLFLKKCRQLIDNNVTPHFIYIYDHMIINKNDYVLLEYADGNLENWLEYQHTEMEWLSFLFQILQGIYVMQYNIKIYHADLKPKNILYKKIKHGYFKYKIKDKIYYVPTFGFLFMIADFGKSQCLLIDNNEIAKNNIQSLINDNSDFEHIESLPKRILVTALENKYKNIDEFLEFINNLADNNFYKYLKTEKEKISLQLKNYPEHIKTKMLLRSLLYYALENKFVGHKDIDEKYYSLKYPPNNIDEFIERIFSLKIPIDVILSKFTFFVKECDANIIQEFIVN